MTVSQATVYDFVCAQVRAGGTFVRSTVGLKFTPKVDFRTIPANVPRFDHDLTGAIRGVLIERSVVEYLPNSIATGAVTGSPGTMPTKWTASVPAGLTRTVVGTGVEDGIPYCDIRWNGTATAAGASKTLFTSALAASGHPATLQGDIWSGRFFLKLAAGSTSGITAIQTHMAEFSSAGVDLQTHNASVLPGAITDTLVNNSVALLNQTMLQATVADVAFGLQWGAPASAAIDVTFRIGLPTFQKAAQLRYGMQTNGTGGTTGADSYSVGLANVDNFAGDALTGTIRADFEFELVGAALTQHVLSVNDGTASNAIHLSCLNGTLKAEAVVGGSTVSSLTLGTMLVGVKYRAALSWSAAGITACLNGRTVVSGSSITVPALTTLEFGQEAGANQLDGWLRAAWIAPSAFTAADMVAWLGSPSGS